MTRLNHWKLKLFPLLLALVLALSACQGALPGDWSYAGGGAVSLDDIPAYSGQAYIAVNDNQPFFTQDELTTQAFETYSELDSLGRCGTAYANICRELMPTEPRGEIGSVKPTGWQSVKYDFVDGKSLYNRCHLIGFQLAGENANPKNLITGTRYLNIEGMLPFENLVADYVKETENHVLYRVTPVFQGMSWWPVGWRWRPSLWRTRERACISTSTAITTSRGSPLTMPPGRAAWPQSQPGRMSPGPQRPIS